MLEDVTLIQAYRRIEFFTDQLGLPPDSYRAAVDQAVAMAGRHRYANAIRVAALSKHRSGPQIAQLLSELSLVDVDVQYMTLVTRKPRAAEDRRKPFAPEMRFFVHRDMIVGDVMYYSQFFQGVFLSYINQISPDSPLVTALFVESSIKKTPEELAEIEKRFAGHAEVLRAGPTPSARRQRRRRRTLLPQLPEAVSRSARVRPAGRDVSQTRRPGQVASRARRVARGRGLYAGPCQHPKEAGRLFHGEQEV